MNEKKNIVWTTNIPLREASSYLRGEPAKSGSWLDTLFDVIEPGYKDSANLFVLHCSGSVKKEVRFVQNGTNYIIFPRRKFGVIDNFKKEIAHLERLVKELKPDLYHVHGTEDIYGLVSDKQPGKVLINLQGINGHITRLQYADLSLWKYLKLVLPKLKIQRLVDIIYLNRLVKNEEEVIAKNDVYVNHTFFDKAHVLGRNPKAKFYYMQDILREEFWSDEWDVESATPWRIYTTLSERTYKGIFLLIETMGILKKFNPNVRLAVAGGMTGPIAKLAFKKIAEMGLTENFEFLGQLDAEGMVAEMKKASVFVLASYIENHSLSLQEAQTFGMPCVAAYTGGIPSIMTDNETGLFYPGGDPYIFAGKISTLMEDRNLALRLGENARNLRKEENLPEHIFAEMSKVYAELLNEEPKNIAIPTL